MSFLTAIKMVSTDNEIKRCDLYYCTIYKVKAVLRIDILEKNFYDFLEHVSKLDFDGKDIILNAVESISNNEATKIMLVHSKVYKVNHLKSTVIRIDIKLKDINELVREL